MITIVLKYEEKDKVWCATGDEPNLCIIADGPTPEIALKRFMCLWKDDAEHVCDLCKDKI